MKNIRHSPGYLLIAFKLTEASSSDCPPDKNTIPGTAAGTVRCNAVTVAAAFCSAVYFVAQLWPDKGERTLLSYSNKNINGSYFYRPCDPYGIKFQGLLVAVKTFKKFKI